MKKRNPPFPVEVRERAVRLFLEHGNIPPAVAEANYYAAIKAMPIAA